MYHDIRHPNDKGEGDADSAASPREPGPVGLAGLELGAGISPGDRCPSTASRSPTPTPAPRTEGRKHPRPGNTLHKVSCVPAAPNLTTQVNDPLISTTCSLIGASKHFNHLTNQIVGRAAFPTVTLLA